MITYITKCIAILLLLTMMCLAQLNAQQPERTSYFFVNGVLLSDTKTFPQVYLTNDKDTITVEYHVKRSDEAKSFQNFYSTNADLDGDSVSLLVNYDGTFVKCITRQNPFTCNFMIWVYSEPKLIKQRLKSDEGQLEYSKKDIKLIIDYYEEYKKHWGFGQALVSTTVESIIKFDRTSTERKLIFWNPSYEYF